MPRHRTSVLFAILLGTPGLTIAQSCTLPPRALRTHDPWLAQYFTGPTQPNTVNLFFDLQVQTTIEVNGFRIPTFDQGAPFGAPPLQVGNIAEARVYLIPGSRSGHEQNRAAWGVAQPASGQPEAFGELRVVAWPGESPIRNWKNAAGAPTPFLLQPGQYGVCIELIPTSWNGTALIPGQTNVPLLSPGPLHVLIAATSPGTPWSDPFVSIQNDGVMQNGWQTVVGGGALAPNPSLGGVFASINMVLDHTPQVPGLAGRARFGSGCYAAPRMVYEVIPAQTNPIDLVDTEWTFDFVPDVTGGRYVIAPGGPPYDSATAIVNGIDLLAMSPTVTTSTVPWHDGSLVVALPTAAFPQGFPHPGGSCTDITINANGRIYLGNVVDPLTTFAPFGDPATLRAHAQLMPFCCNLRPEPWSGFRLENPGPNGGIRVTWWNVPSFTGPSDFQIELLPSGDVTFAFGPRLANDGADNAAFVGFTAGDEAMALPRDWSTITSLTTGSGTTPPVLDLSADPRVGTTIDAIVSDLGATTLQPVGGFMAITLASLPSGVSLGAIGLPGCDAHVDLGQLVSIVLLANPGSGVLRWPWSIPPGVPSVSIFLQAGTFTPDVHNPLDLLMTNGLCAHVGQ